MIEQEKRNLIQGSASVSAGKHGRAGSRATGDAAPDQIVQASDIAGQFIDMVFVPHQMRALIGDDRVQLDVAASRRIDDAVDLLTDAGWLVTFDAS